jgi:hypothetical protein
MFRGILFSVFSTALIKSLINVPVYIPRLHFLLILNFSCYSQLRASRARISPDLLFAGNHRLFGKQTGVPLFWAFAKSVLDDSILKRVLAYIYPPPPGGQHVRGRVQQLTQAFQFVVYENSDCLEGFSRRMTLLFGPIHWPGRG